MKAASLLRRARETFTEHLALKALSVVLALGLYAYHHGATNAERSFSVGVVALTPPEEKGRALVTQIPSTVRVTFRGTRSALDDLRADDLGSVELKLRRGTESFAAYDAAPLRVPSGVEARVDPPGIDVAWDDVIAREVPVLVPLEGKPVAGFAVQGAPSPEPRFVSARGPRSQVETLQMVRTEPFELFGLEEGAVTRKLALDLPPSRITLDHRTVEVVVQVDRERDERLFSKVAVHVVGPKAARTVPADVDVRVSGPSALIASLRPELVVPMIDVASLGGDPQKPGNMTAEPKISIEGCTAIVVPTSVLVRW